VTSASLDLAPGLAAPAAPATVKPAAPAASSSAPAATAVADSDRDTALDLARGLAMVILVVNHMHLDSWLKSATSAVLSAAEVLVLVSGVVAGMVFGRRWRARGPRATTLQLLRRARKLYVAAVVVGALVGLLSLVPWLATDAVTVSPTMRPSYDLYEFDGPLRTLVAIVTLEAGPWQFNIVGFFVAMLAVTPVILWALERGWWPVVIAASWGLFALGRAWPVDILPTQSERPFPVLVWQLLFVHGMVLGRHREQVARAIRTGGGLVAGAVVALALAAVYLRVHGPGFDPLGLDRVLGWDAAGRARWEAAHFDKSTLDLARLAVMVSLTAAIYLALQRFERPAARLAGWLLIPLGRNSFYVFIMHVFICVAVASVPVLAGPGLGPVGNVAVQLACLGLLLALVRHRVLFAWVPR
jgi:hypothetical protein